MSVVTLIGAGQMASALTFPLFENGHEVRLVGSPLDDAVIDRLREDNYHVNLRRTLHDGINYIKCADVKEAIKGADLIVCGISSFGVEWFADEILPILDESIPLISVTKGMLDYEDGTMQTYPEYWTSKLPEGSKQEIYAIGGPCTARDLADHDPSFVGYCGPKMETLRIRMDSQFVFNRLLHYQPDKRCCRLRMCGSVEEWICTWHSIGNWN